MSWYRKIQDRLRYRLTHNSKFPKGDVVSFLLQIARRGFEPTHIIDVGANRAKWSRKAHNLFPQCSFTLIEPQIEMKPYLDQFCARAPHSRWILAGAGAERGELPLTLIDPVSCTFAMSEDAARARSFERRTVPIITLDEVAEADGHVPDLVKIDAEGFEPQVMRGARSLLGKTEVFLLEASLYAVPGWPTFLEEIVMMADYGYDLYDFTTFQRSRGVLALMEVAFVRRGGRLQWPPA
jgi:FkbM family methyltransferase